MAGSRYPIWLNMIEEWLGFKQLLNDQRKSQPLNSKRYKWIFCRFEDISIFLKQIIPNCIYKQDDACEVKLKLYELEKLYDMLSFRKSIQYKLFVLDKSFREPVLSDL